ncbi:MAG: pseudouridine synthase [Candidatus Marinimicrobia bacterium]|mgnify:FL=1|jgi:16S rRNA pseudouridine516 synthase|nr:pseudouridine synthase [Candidatus Neomarinimicrobiota bacterium]MBT3633447.1 pseudouridine synthase [Candidatus Neomarinimicrobiota bacterium]MBT3681590.1 pseudouridine synthase [Candidatus Neomarinimicrobiota bacterium]MBT3758443.1 pseudouridine synthase [Candidatus Neomarinimicrobiota bacterium]MBT3894903.1 pseudouridine synthase [Candidatus Neomarinimicrobiota bacterium]
MKSERIDRLFSRLGICHRKDIQLMLRDKRILFQGMPVKRNNQKVNAEDILFDGAKIQHLFRVAVVFNKPLGLICSRLGSDIIFDVLPSAWINRNPPVNSAGRLDKDTSGIIIITDDGELNHKLTSPKYGLTKTYELDTAHPFQGNEPELFKNGIQLRGEKQLCKPAELEITSERNAVLKINEGKYHQVKRMIGAVGNRIVSLHRSHIGTLGLGDLQPGQWRDLENEDMQLLGLKDLES